MRLRTELSVANEYPVSRCEHLLGQEPMVVLREGSSGFSLSLSHLGVATNHIFQGGEMGSNTRSGSPFEGRALMTTPPPPRYQSADAARQS